MSSLSFNKLKASPYSPYSILHFIQASALINSMSFVDARSPAGQYLPYMSFQTQIAVNIHGLKASMFDNLLILVFDKSSITLDHSEISNGNN